MISSHCKKITKDRLAFGKRMKALRKELGISQETLAERSNLHPTYVGSVERGERNISYENILALARGLRCSPKDLMPE